MYVQHFSASTLSFQNLEIPSASSSFVLGFTVVPQKCFSSCRSNSIGFRSGGSGGVFHQLISFSSMKVLAMRLVCLGSLSCWKRWPCGYALFIKGSNPFVRISETKNLASIVPSKISNFVGPLFERPAHTCTLRGCFGFPFSLGCSHSRWKLILL